LIKIANAKAVVLRSTKAKLARMREAKKQKLEK